MHVKKKEKKNRKMHVLSKENRCILFSLHASLCLLVACALACALACAWLVLWLVFGAWLVIILPGLKKKTEEREPRLDRILAPCLVFSIGKRRNFVKREAQN